MSECHELCPSRMGYACICFEMRAEAWQEGCQVGFSNARTDNTFIIPVNPYRKEVDNG